MDVPAHKADGAVAGSVSADDPAAVGLRLIRLGSRIHRLHEECLEGLSVPLSVRQFRILDRVDHEITTLGRLAALARRRPSTITKSADSLVRQGLLTRTEGAQDRRTAVLALTQPGQALLTEARAAINDLALWLASASGMKIAVLAAFVDGLYDETEREMGSLELAGHDGEP